MAELATQRALENLLAILAVAAAAWIAMKVNNRAYDTRKFHRGYLRAKRRK